MAARSGRACDDPGVRILIVEDDDAIAKPLSDGLRREGFQVTRVATGEEALEAALPDLVLLDLRLPGMDGTEVCRRLRARSDVPIIVVTAKGEEVDRVVGLELGADDYIVKPFGFRELLARIRAVMRRVHPGSDRSQIQVGELEIDVRGRRAILAGESLALTTKEFDLLALLSEPGAVVSRRILREVWDTEWLGRRRRSTCMSRRCARSSATRPGSRPCAASGCGSSPAVSRRLLVSYLALAIVVLALLEIPLGISYARNERHDLSVNVERDAVALASLAEDALEQRTSAPPALTRLARRYQSDTGGRVIVVDAEGRALVDSESQGVGADFSTRPEIAAALDGTVATGTRHSRTLGTDLLYVAVPVASGGVVHGAVRITCNLGG